MPGWRRATWIARACDDRYAASSPPCYRRNCRIVYPPVDTSRFRIASEVGDYYLIAARFIPYKRLDLAIKACNQLGRPLKIVGSGRHGQELRSLAGPTVEFLGRVSDAQLTDLMARARAYIMPGEEDFGISPVEANACGRPVIAYAAGGALDSQIDGVTGVLFAEQTVDSLCQAIERSEQLEFDPERIRAHALRFDTCVFKAEMRQVIADAMAARRKAKLVNELHTIVVNEGPALSTNAGRKQGIIERS
jgi:glycosyltransferase involved in cell wall biosynthesis